MSEQTWRRMAILRMSCMPTTEVSGTVILCMKRLGIDKFYDLESYEIGEGQAVNWGMKDIPFFEQSVELMKEMPQPFYSRLITLTNHHPFDLDEEDMLIPAYDFKFEYVE